MRARYACSQALAPSMLAEIAHAHTHMLGRGFPRGSSFEYVVALMLTILAELFCRSNGFRSIMQSMPQSPYDVAVLTRCGLVYFRESSFAPNKNLCIQVPSWLLCGRHDIGRGKEQKEPHSRRDRDANNASHVLKGSQVDLCKSRVRG